MTPQYLTAARTRAEQSLALDCASEVERALAADVLALAGEAARLRAQLDIAECVITGDRERGALMVAALEMIRAAVEQALAPLPAGDMVEAGRG